MIKRKDTTTSTTFHNVGTLLRKFAENKDTPRDRAMASILAPRMERRGAPRTVR